MDKKEQTMKEIKLEQFKVNGIDVTYKSLILSAVGGHMPQGGVTFTEMKARLALIGKIEAVPEDGTLEVTGDEFKTIANLVVGTRWTIISKDLVKFIELFEGAADAKKE